jgi:hypothetical protein
MPGTPMVFAGDELGLESEQRRLLVLAAWAEHGPLRLPTGALGLAGEAPTCTATPTRCHPTPRRLPDPARRATFQLWQLT